MKALRTYILWSAVLFLIVSCAGKTPEKPPDLFWPLPPEKPRIKFLDVIIGSLDAEARFGKLKDTLLGSPVDTKFTKPFGVAERDGIMYVTDIGAIHVYDFVSGRFHIYGKTHVTIPTGIDVDNDGNIFVGEPSRRSVLVFNREGEFIREFGKNDLMTVGGVAVDRQKNRVIVSDSKNHKIFVYDLGGQSLFQIGERGTEDGQFNIPYGVAVDSQSRIYVIDAGNFRLQIFSPEGAFIKTIGRVGTQPGTFARPKGVAVDSEGHIYVLDSAFANFQIFDFEGNTLLAVGSPGKEIGEFLLPSSIYINKKDEIFVVDQINLRVQMFQYLKDQ